MTTCDIRTTLCVPCDNIMKLIKFIAFFVLLALMTGIGFFMVYPDVSRLKKENPRRLHSWNIERQVEKERQKNGDSEKVGSFISNFPVPHEGGDHSRR